MDIEKDDIETNVAIQNTNKSNEVTQIQPSDNKQDTIHRTNDGFEKGKHPTHEKLEAFKNGKVKVTRNNRYNAYRRMGRSHTSSSICIALVSLEIVALGVLELIYPNSPLNREITGLTIILSCFIIVLSLIISTFDYRVKMVNYHQCGMKLSELCDEIDSVLTYNTIITEDKFKEIIDKYNQIMLMYNLNHERKDYKKFQLDDFNGKQMRNKRCPIEKYNKDDKEGVSNKEDKVDKDDSSQSEFYMSWWQRTCAWLHWHIFDVNVLYWILTLSGAVMVVMLCLISRSQYQSL